MNLRIFLTILTLSVAVSVAFARESDPKLLKHIQKQCDWLNDEISLDDRMDCVTDYVNCAIVGAGETDWSQLDDKCLNQAAKRRLDGQFQD